MGIFSKPKAPPPINVKGVQGEQNAQNQQNIQQQAQYNRPNQYGPFGSVTWTQNPDGSFSQKTEVSGDELAYRDSLKDIAFEGTLGALSDLKNQQSVGRVNADPTGLMGLGASGIYGFNPTAGSMEAFKQADDFWSKYEQPLQDRQAQALRTDLAVRGHSDANAGDPNSAYSGATDQLARQQAEAKDRFRMGYQNQFYNQANTQDTNAWNRATGLFGLGQSEAQRLFGEDATGAGIDITRASTLGNLSRGIMPTPQTTPGVSSFSNVSVPNVDLTQLYNQQWNQQFQNYQQKLQQQNAMWGGLAGLGGSLLNVFGPNLFGGTTGGMPIDPMGN